MHALMHVASATIDSFSALPLPYTGLREYPLGLSLYSPIILFSFQVKPVKIHHLGPRSRKILHKFFLPVTAGIDLSNCTQF